MKKYATFLFIMTGLTLQLYGQKDIPDKATRYYQKAIDHLHQAELDKANKDLNKALEEYPDYTEAYMRKGELFLDKGSYDTSFHHFEKVISLNPDFGNKAYFYAGQAAFRGKQYDEAIHYYKKYLARDRLMYSNKKEAKWHLKNARFRKKALKNPVPFEPKNMGPKINSEHAEYLPSITADGKTIIFTRKLKRAKGTYRRPDQKYNEDFFISHKKEGQWLKAHNLGNNINTKLNEGAQTITPDGRYIFFTACNRPDGMGSCDIYLSKRSGEKWSKPQNLGPPVNSKKWESQPAISPDGQTLYFSSNLNGGEGKKDLWKVERTPRGRWTKPQNLGPTINTSEDEESPFMHVDNKTLYFSSEGHVGMGKEDLYLTRRKGDTGWTSPKNLGYPINTEGFETSLVINAAGDRAFFASKRFEGFGKLDLYSFQLPSSIRPEPVSYVEGKVFDATNKKPLEAHFELIDLSTGKTVMSAISSEVDGEFLVCLPSGKEYALNVSKRGYLFYSEHFSLPPDKVTDPYQMDIPLQPIQKGKKVVLKNIFFETDKYKLKEKSKVELKRLVRFLKHNSTVKIEIAGHTDNRGKKAYNKELSRQRAKSVYDYLLKQGIAKERLQFEGYGETSPIASNETKAGRAQNRRTEFIIIEK